MELAFALQENPCHWFPRKVAVLRYSPSTSWMSVRECWSMEKMYVHVCITIKGVA